MLLIYHPQPGPRLNYIISVLFRGEAMVTDHLQIFFSHDGPRINYSEDEIGGQNAGSELPELCIRPHGLLHQEGIQAQDIKCISWRGLPVFFATGNGLLPFDIFAASFYLLSRYEEYQCFEKDLYGRFPHIASVAFQNGFLDRPLIHCWMQELEKIIREKFQGYQLPKTSFELIPTYDIDIAYSYLHQPVLKNLYGFFRDLLQGKFESFEERSKVYAGKQKDPFDQYDWLHQLHLTANLHPVYFFLLAQKRKGVDRNIAPKSAALCSLIKSHQQRYQIGIHPSWQSGEDFNVLQKEIDQLSSITDSAVLHSRQHYLRMQLPETYQQLLKAGIKKDYTMGYGTINGFRASYTLPFYWYDVTREQTTDLKIHPFCYMDANAIFEMRYPAYEAKKELEDFYQIIQQVNGQMICIFHNHFLTDQPEWIEWKKIYEAFILRL